MIIMKLNKYTCPLTDRKFFSLIVGDHKRHDVLCVEQDSPIDELINGFKKLVTLMEAPRDQD